MLGVIVKKTGDPLSRTEFFTLLSDSAEDLRLAGRVAVDATQVLASGEGGMAMGINEAGYNGSPLKVDPASAGRGKPLHIVVAANRKDSVPRNRDRLRSRVSRIDSDDVAIQQEEIDLCSIQAPSFDGSCRRSDTRGIGRAR